MKRKDIIEFEVGKMEFGGVTRSIVEDKRVKMKGGITGQTVKAFVKKSRKDSADVKFVEVVKPSLFETEPTCNHFRQCGGCTMLSVSYENQLRFKKEQVLELFKEKEIDGFDFLGIQGSPQVRGYRNKMEFTFGDEFKGGPLCLGMHKVGKSMDIITVDSCELVHQDFRTILTATIKFFEERNMSYYRVMRHTGYLRHLVVRRGTNTDEMMVNIVTTSQVDQLENPEFDMNEYKDMLLTLDLKSNLVSILHTINDNLSDSVQADELKVLHGVPYFHEKVLGLTFKVSPFSFFQTNTKGAESLYSIARDFVGNDDDEKIVFDLYSGTGSIGQIMASEAYKVYGIELVEEAVEAANENAKINGIDNCEFIAGDVAKTVSSLEEDPDLIIVDPPRPGIHKDAIRDISNFGAREIIYISCNPKSLVEDLVSFKGYGYKVKKVKLMDLFPNTPHCETVCLLSK